jgi:uncharacterized protein (DUF2267 family)
MTDGTQSSKNPDRDAEPTRLVEMLAGEPMAAAVLALCSAERLSPVTDSLVKSPLASSAVRAGLDLGWSAVAIRRDPRPDTLSDLLGRAITDLEEIADSLIDEIPYFQEELNNAMNAAIYALQAVREGDSAAAAGAISACRDVYFQLAVEAWQQSHDYGSLATRDALAEVESYPVVRDEVDREISEARVISDWGSAISPERVEQLRRAAHADGEILVGLIRSKLTLRTTRRDPTPQRTSSNAAVSRGATTRSG